jgi:hypothetical protein
MTPLVAFAALAAFIVLLFVGIYWLSTRIDSQDRPSGEMDDEHSGPGHSHSAGSGSGDGPSIGPA